MSDDTQPTASSVSEEIHYRKKPIIVDAFHFTGKITHEAPLWVISALADNRIRRHRHDHTCAEIVTIDPAFAIAHTGDWILRGVKGELYPCKPDIFAATYEPVEAALSAKPAQGGEEPFAYAVTAGLNSHELFRDKVRAQMNAQERVEAGQTGIAVIPLYRRTAAPPQPIPTSDEALRKALKALAEGYFFETKDDRYIIIKNPDFKEDDGSDPNLVIDTAAMSRVAALSRARPDGEKT